MTAGPAPKGRINLSQAVVLVLSPPNGGEFLVHILEGFGVRRPYVRSGREQAMAVCRETDLDLIVCDGALENGATYDFVAELRRSDLKPNRFAPVIVFQGHTPLDQVEKARDFGANSVVAKPVTPRIFLERLLWIAQKDRAFIELDDYVGPDRSRRWRASVALITSRPENRLAKTIFKPGGKTVAKALEDAERNLGAFRGASLDELRAKLQEAQSLAVESRASPPAAFVRRAYALSGEVLDIAGMWGLAELGEAAFSLCELLDGFGARKAWDWPAVQVHLNGLLVLADPEKTPPEGGRSVVDGLARVRERMLR